MDLERPRNDHHAIDWDARQGGAVKRWLNRLQSGSLVVERLVGRVIGDRNLNPLYHTGTITVFLLVLLLVTGIYLTLFYQFGFDATYEAVAGIEENPLSRVIRAIHRYASAATLITAVLHAWRTFFMDRFRGARWLAWVTGVASVTLVWLAGVTGYWMIWDVTAGPLNQTLIDLVRWIPGGEALIVNTLDPAFAGTGWVFLVLVITAHVLVSALIGLMLWYHLRRLNRAHWLPPAHWMWVTGGVLVLASIAVPVGLQPALDPSTRVDTLDIDLWFLSYLPAALRAPGVLWGTLVVIASLGAAIPWLLKRRLPEPVVVDADRCTGCTLCYVDCPYSAVSMERQANGELLAIVDSALCVSCGICIGSCPPLAISFDGSPVEEEWPVDLSDERRGAVVSYLCERHVQQGTVGEGVTVPVTCVGAIHPDEIEAVLSSGAERVRLIGCPADDCANREGNEWTVERLNRTRRPKAGEGLDLQRVDIDWRAPGDEESEGQEVRPRQVVPVARWKALVPAAALFAALAAGQLALTFVPVDAYGDDSAIIEISMKHRVGAPIVGVDGEAAFGGNGTRLQVEIDDETVLDRSLDGDRVTAFEQVGVVPGEHDVVVMVADEGVPPRVVFEESLSLESRQIVAVTIADAAGAADPERGEELYNTAAIRGGAGCRVCHSLRAGDDGVAPSLSGVATRAASRVPGLTAEEYLRQSLLDPDSYIVDGYRAGQMRADVVEGLTDAQIDDLIAFLETMR